MDAGQSQVKFGLRERDLLLIQEVAARFPEIEELRIFGSRALGTHRPASDVDLCLLGPAVSEQTVARVHAILENDLPIPLFFDVVRFDGIQSAALREHIERFGCPLR